MRMAQSSVFRELSSCCSATACWKQATCQLLFPNDLDEHPLGAVAVELTVEDLLPRAKVEPASGDGHHHLTAHQLPLHVSIGIVLARAIVIIDLWTGIEGSKLLQPFGVVAMQAGLVVVDEDARGDMHGVDEAEALLHARLVHQRLDRRRDIFKAHPGRDVEGEVLGE